MHQTPGMAALHTPTAEKGLDDTSQVHSFYKPVATAQGHAQETNSAYLLRFEPQSEGGREEGSDSSTHSG
jgi:hypothetical protein